jgi:glycosidase
MPDPTSITQIDLTPIFGKEYFQYRPGVARGFIYFLMVDRFQDEKVRPVTTGTGRTAGVDTPDTFYGGKISGITNNLAYIAEPSCTAIWLSPILENNQNAYHGYDINNYLSIDPRFGTKQDLAPENQFGDILTFKDFANDDDTVGSDVINTLIETHAYWIREADVDGFRVDAVKHMGELACSRFCSNIRDYAYSLGKRGFFLFGEVAAPSDDLYNRYIGQSTSRIDGNNTVFFGLDSVLDFRLAEGVFADGNNAPLREVLTGNKSPQTLSTGSRHSAIEP